VAEASAATARRFARELTAAEHRLRACGLTGRAAFTALCRHLAERLELPRALVPEGPDAPLEADLARLPLTGELDLFGLAYERFFTDLFKGRAGQYFTPRPVVDFAVSLAQIAPGDQVLDPACGAGGFLVAAAGRGASVYGVEIDPDLVSLARINLALQGARPEAVQRGDLFRLFRPPLLEPVDVVLANPPFSVVIRDPALLGEYELGRGRTSMVSDQLFLEAAWRMLKPGGRLCAVLPWSVAANPSGEIARAWADRRFTREAVIALPEGVFRPFGGTATRACLVLLRRRPAATARQLMARITDPGYDPTRADYRPTAGDDFAQLTRFIGGAGDSGAAGSSAGVRGLDAAWVAPGGDWTPGAHLDRSSIAAERRKLTLGDLVRPAGGTLDPTTAPDARFTEIDLADLDKTTGEVAGARARSGRDFKSGQAKAAFSEGDLLFGRMRPYLNNVGVAARPRDGMPGALVGSSEWIPLRAEREPFFALLALRSPFVREQLKTTGGQTRPRARPDALPAIEVPDPGPELRERLDSLVGELHRRRLEARRGLAQVEALYVAWGRGDLEDHELEAALKVIL